MDLTAIGGPLISAGASLIGSKMAADASNKAARLNAIYQAQEAERARAFELANAQRQEALQREFAQSGIQWRVADARAAGIHPMAALGAQTQSFSPIQVSGHPSSASPYAGASTGSGVAAMGQDISRALQATRTQEERTDAYAKTVQDLQIQNMKLNNAVLASQVARMNQGTGPAFPSPGGNAMPGQGNSSPRVKMKPQEVVYSSKEDPVSEPKPITDVGHAQTGKNRFFPVPAKDVKERIEDNVFAEAMWTVRNNLAPALGFNMHPPTDMKLKSKDHRWYMNPFTGEYRQRRIDWLDKAADHFDSYTKNMFPKTPWSSNWK